MFRRSLAPTHKVPHILGIGYLLQVKRWDLLITAGHSLARKGYDFVLQIAGDGPLQPALKLLASNLGISERVQFLGHVNNIQDVLEGAAFVVHTADAEGCPNSVMEAMACGRPVVAIDAGDIPTLIEHGKTGFLVSHGQQDKLVEYMEKLLLERQLCQSMGQSARSSAEQKFGLDRLVADTVEAYRSAGWSDA